jgi:hypothetical protein
MQALQKSYNDRPRSDFVQRMLSWRHSSTYPLSKTMNRRKKLNQLLKANAKKASAKLAPQNKNKYISKADRAKLAEEASQDSTVSSES